MSTKLPLPKNKKLNVIFRVEAGCLGPNGDDHVNDFCVFAQKETKPLDSDFVEWSIHPRADKSLPEMEYKLNNKKLTRDKTERFLALFDHKINEFEENFHEILADLIDEYLSGK